LSKEDVSALIKSEIASRLEQYEQQLAAAKAESKRQKAELKVKEAEINSLRKEIAALQDQAKSPAHSTAASSPPDLPDPPDKLERWGCMREIREVTKKVGELERVLTKHVGEIAQKYTAVQVEQIRGTGEVVAMRQNHSALEKQLDALKQLLVSEREARQIQWATRSRKSSGPSSPPPRRSSTLGV
jgi:chromosome segregation ATPase